jgi:diguanylate cyclase (GGDEF)-like protein
VLVKTAELFDDIVREQDSVARWGGEEYIALLPETDAEGAQVMAERLRRAIEGHSFQHNKSSVHTTMTFGLCEIKPGMNPLDAIKKADHALMRGKEEGRNRIVVA